MGMRTVLRRRKVRENLVLLSVYNPPLLNIHHHTLQVVVGIILKWRTMPKKKVGPTQMPWFWGRRKVR